MLSDSSRRARLEKICELNVVAVAPKEISGEKGLQRIAHKRKVNKLRIDSKARVPHLIFTSIECHPRFDLEIQTE